MCRLALRFAVAFAICVAALSTGAVASASPAVAAPTRMLLAVGDSLAAGYQPTDSRALPPVDPVTGFRDTGFPGGYASVIAAARHLRLVDLGCPGETIASLQGTPALGACSSLYRGEAARSSQLAAAIAVLDAHPGQVAAVTVDIGANDLDHCASATGINASCLVRTDANLASGLSSVLGRLSSALHRDDPGAVLATMNYYDPFLARAEQPGGTHGDAEAAGSLAAVNALNVELSAIGRSQHVQVADVARAFQIDAPSPLRTFQGHQLANNVATACDLTWMCPASGSGTGPDIHPTTLGYLLIADAFLTVLGIRA